MRIASQCLGGVMGEWLLPERFIHACRVQTWKVSRVLNQGPIRHAYFTHLIRGPCNS